VPTIRSHVQGERIADIGCGGGQIAKRLASAGISVFGIDPSHSQVQRFGRTAGSHTWPIQARAEALPFHRGTFDSLFSSCAWKHWPTPKLGTAECVRVTRSGGSVTVIEIDGNASAEDFWAFARTSRIPFGLRRAYLRFTMRTVVGVAPSRDELGSSFEGLSISGLSVARLQGLPFLIATCSVLA
jgi:ubiquinone/menaquinone biosynthesis C-methylase UbiE